MASLSKEENKALWLESLNASPEKKKKIIDKLVVDNQKLVYATARSFSVGKENYPDLIQEGIVGLVKAVHKYDGSTAFSTYATYWIKAYMYNYIIHCSGILKVSRSKKSQHLFWNMNKIAQRLKAEGKDASPDEIAEEASRQLDVNVKVKDVEKMRARMKPIASIDGSSSDTDDKNSVSNYLNNISIQTSVTPEALLGRIRVITDAREILNSLSERDKKILEGRLFNDVQETLESLGKSFSPAITKERVRQIEAQAIEGIKRSFMRKGYTGISLNN